LIRGENGRSGKGGFESLNFEGSGFGGEKLKPVAARGVKENRKGGGEKKGKKSTTISGASYGGRGRKG